MTDTTQKRPEAARRILQLPYGVPTSTNRRIRHPSRTVVRLSPDVSAITERWSRCYAVNVREAQRLLAEGATMPKGELARKIADRLGVEAYKPSKTISRMIDGGALLVVLDAETGEEAAS